jgi:signal transduction histidine kinase
VLVSSRSTRRYRERDLRFVEKLAHLVALAVDNAQLYIDAQRAIAARDEVLGVVAHDLRNPLNTILLQLQLMTRAGQGHERRRQRPIEVIRRASHRMNRLIERMLDVACLEGGALRMAPEPLSVRSLLEEVGEAHREIAAKAGLHLRFEVEEDLPEIHGDRDRLLQAIDNLVGNAVKFTPHGGEIALGAASREGEVLFWVLDTGRGIAREDLDRLFDRFWRSGKAGQSGTGLGLAIAKGIVAAHGGRIWVKSRRGQGTTFYFTVPVAASTQVERP